MQWKTHEKAMTFFNDSWIWLVMRFSSCSGKGHETYPDFYGVQIHGSLMGWKIHGSWLSP